MRACVCAPARAFAAVRLECIYEFKDSEISRNAETKIGLKGQDQKMSCKIGQAENIGRKALNEAEN